MSEEPPWKRVLRAVLSHKEPDPADADALWGPETEIVRVTLVLRQRPRAWEGEVAGEVVRPGVPTVTFVTLNEGDAERQLRLALDEALRHMKEEG